MGKPKTINLDKVLNKSEMIAISDLESAPKSKTVPRGWPLLAEQEGKTWHEKVVNYEKAYGHKVIPVKYRQVTATHVVKRDINELERINEQLEPFWAKGEE